MALEECKTATLSAPLPPDARKKLIEAAKSGRPLTLDREIAINKAISDIRAKYPMCFSE